MTYYLNETFFKNRSYTRWWDQFAHLPWQILETLPNGALIIKNPLLHRTVQVHQDEITPSKNLH